MELIYPLFVLATEPIPYLFSARLPNCLGTWNFEKPQIEKLPKGYRKFAVVTFLSLGHNNFCWIYVYFVGPLVPLIRMTWSHGFKAREDSLSPELFCGMCMMCLRFVYGCLDREPNWENDNSAPAHDLAAVLEPFISFMVRLVL